MNESYQEYINRVARLNLPATYIAQLETIQPSPKFDENNKAVSFPGYTIVTPPNEEDPLNKDFYDRVTLVQKQISQQITSDLFIPIPPSSFHLTLADLIWGASYTQAVAENPDFEANLQREIEASFQDYLKTTNNLEALQWQTWGIAIRPRAIFLSLAPKDQNSYRELINLRNSIYQSSGLISLGIEQQYDLTAHITLGYFGEIPLDLNRSELCVFISQINDRLLDNQPSIITIQEAQLRKFDNMLSYYRQPDWSKIVFKG